MLATTTGPTNRYGGVDGYVIVSVTRHINSFVKLQTVNSSLQIQVGVEFEASTRTQETTFSFGYQMELPEAKMVFRGKNGRYIIDCAIYKYQSVW